jgi:transposase
VQFIKRHTKRVNLDGSTPRFWIHRQLTALGIECLVVNPADIPKSQKDKLQKTDANDSRNIGYRLLKGELRGIHVPDEQQEADRCFFRHRKKILKDLTRCKNRIKGLLAFSGIDLPLSMTMLVGAKTSLFG